MIHFSILIKAVSSIPALNMPDIPGSIEVKPQRPLTEGEFFDFCAENPGLRVEKDKNGKLIIMTPVSFDGGIYEDETYGELRDWRKKYGKGRTLSPSTGFKLPDGSVYSADGAWVSDEKIEMLSAEERKKFAPVVPDFVIEVRSASDRLGRLRRKMSDVWIKNGVRLAWLIDPLRKKAYIYRQTGTVEKVENFDQVLSGEDVCPGFELDLRSLNI